MSKEKILQALVQDSSLFELNDRFHYPVDEKDFNDDEKKLFILAKEVKEKGYKSGKVTEKIARENKISEKAIDTYIKKDGKDAVENFEIYLEPLVNEKMDKQIKKAAFNLAKVLKDENAGVEEKLKAYQSSYESLKPLSKAREGKDFKQLLTEFSTIPMNKEALLTGFKELDETIFGITRGSVSIISGASNHGKTTVGNQIMLYVASVLKKKVLFINIELKEKDIYAKALGFLSRQGYQAHNIDRYDPKNEDDVKKHNERVKRDSLLVDEHIGDRIEVKVGSYTDVQLLDDIREAIKSGVDMIMVDFFQAVSVGTEQEGQKTSRLSKLSENVRDLINKSNTAFVWLSQTNLQNDKVHPMEADIKWTKDMYQDAELEIRVFREFEDKETKVFTPNLSLGLKKTRFAGRIEPIEYPFDGSTGRIGNAFYTSEDEIARRKGFTSFKDWMSQEDLFANSDEAPVDVNEEVKSAVSKFNKLVKELDDHE